MPRKFQTVSYNARDIAIKIFRSKCRNTFASRCTYTSEQKSRGGRYADRRIAEIKARNEGNEKWRVIWN